MDEVAIYFRLGYEHILDSAALDHILFIVALCVGYTLSHWRRVLVLITAFTVGHSITLALATLDLIRIPSSWVELAIPFTIIITAGLGYIPRWHERLAGNYSLAVIFGCIHGLGFSNYLRAMLMGSDSLWRPLLSFNLGLELGQIIIVLIYLALGSLMVRYMRLSRHWWTWFWLSLAIGVSIYLLVDRL